MCENKKAEKPASGLALSLGLSPSDLLPTGGLAILSTNDDDCPFDNPHAGAEELWLRFNPKTAGEVVSKFLVIRSLSSHRIASDFLMLGLRKGIVDRDSLITLYMMQDAGVRANSPIITLQGLWNIQSQAFEFSGGNDVANRIFTKEDIVALANRVVQISICDVRMFFYAGGWFYRHEGPLPFSEEFLVYWYNEAKEYEYLKDKLPSLIAWALYKTYPKQLVLEEVIDRFLQISKYGGTHNHGIHRYMGLCFTIAGDNEEQKQKVLNATADSVVESLKQGMSGLSETRFFIELFLGYTDISEDEKREFLKKIYGECLEIAQRYMEVVSDLLPPKN